MAHDLYRLYAVLFYMGIALVLGAISGGIVYGLDWLHQRWIADRTLARITRQASRRHY